MATLASICMLGSWVVCYSTLASRNGRALGLFFLIPRNLAGRWSTLGLNCYGPWWSSSPVYYQLLMNPTGKRCGTPIGPKKKLALSGPSTTRQLQLITSELKSGFISTPRVSAIKVTSRKLFFTVSFTVPTPGWRGNSDWRCCTRPKGFCPHMDLGRCSPGSNASYTPNFLTGSNMGRLFGPWFMVQSCGSLDLTGMRRASAMRAGLHSRPKFRFGMRPWT
jgi:hypothetical protein